jgi:uncharacterized protein YndB with AHSA1/START domain
VNEGDVRVQRRYDATPAEIWAALTDPESVRRWLGRPMPGAVTIVEAQRVLEVEWNLPGEPASRVRFELHAEENGVRLVVDHRGLDRAASTGYGEGWKVHLADLDTLVKEGATT